MALLQKKSIGLDIADSTIEAVELENSGMGVKILNTSRIFLPSGVVEGGRIKDEKILAQYVIDIFLKAKPKAITAKKIVFGLPEAQTFLHVFSLGAYNKKNLGELVLQEAKFNIPLKEDDLSFSYKIIAQSAGNTKILIAAASKTVIREWYDFFAKLKVEVECFDIETLAVYRGLFGDAPSKPVCVADIGARTTNISIFGKSGLFYSFSSHIAGSHFTNLIAQALNLSVEEAEKKKIKEGLKSRSKKVFALLDGELKKLENYLAEALLYFKKNTGFDVEEIILVGGSANLPGLIDHFKTKFKQTVAIGASRFENNKTPLEYIEAIGLALRSMIKDEISIPIEDKRINKKAAQEAVKWEEKEKDQKTIGRRNRIILLLIILAVGLLSLISVLYWRNQIKGERIKAQNQMRDAESAVAITESTSMNQEISAPVEFITSTEKVTGITFEIINTEGKLVDVYLEPDAGSEIVAQVGEGVEFEAVGVGRNINWHKLKINGELSGWIKDQYVKP